MVESVSTDYDSPWKEALDIYFRDFLRLLAPWLYERIDWSHDPVFLDKELQAIAQHGRRGRLYADKLVQVVGTHQQPFGILIHVEVQGGRMTPRRLAAFGRRMYRYAWRIEERYLRGAAGERSHVGSRGTGSRSLDGAASGAASNDAQELMGLVSLGVLTASTSSDTHLTYTWGGALANSGHFRFRVVHLAAWLDRWEALEEAAKENPFAVGIMAQLQAQVTRKQGRQRLVSKTSIVRLLYHYRYGKRDVFQLLRIIDWMMALPAELEPAFGHAMIAMEKEKKMAFVTSFERLGEQRGQAALLQSQLNRKFGPLPDALRQRVQAATPTQLEAWSLNILDAQTVEEVFVD